MGRMEIIEAEITKIFKKQGGARGSRQKGRPHLRYLRCWREPIPVPHCCDPHAPPQVPMQQTIMHIWCTDSGESIVQIYVRVSSFGMHAVYILSAPDWGDFYRYSREITLDKMYRACTYKDQTLKKIRTLAVLSLASCPYFVQCQKRFSSKRHKRRNNRKQHSPICMLLVGRLLPSSHDSAPGSLIGKAPNPLWRNFLRAKFRRMFSLTRAKNAAKFWRKNLQIFALWFPGKVAARNFTKNLPHFPRGTKQNSFTARFWEGGAPKIHSIAHTSVKAKGSNHTTNAPQNDGMAPRGILKRGRSFSVQFPISFYDT